MLKVVSDSQIVHLLTDIHLIRNSNNNNDGRNHTTPSREHIKSNNFICHKHGGCNGVDNRRPLTYLANVYILLYIFFVYYILAIGVPINNIADIDVNNRILGTVIHISCIALYKDAN